jgi:hypothetical protein
MPAQVADLEAVFERLAPPGVVSGQRDQALAQVPRGGHPEVAAQPTR